MARVLFLFLLLLADSPIDAQFVTKDIPNFWRAFDAWQTGYKGNPFADLYVTIGSQGVKDFTPNRIKSADSLLAKVRQQTAEYVKSRAGSLRILVLDKEKQCRAAFYALKYWYPQATFPPVYFVIGRFNSGGTSSKNGLIVGAEKVDPDNVPFIVAHELIHFQQHIPYKYEILLESCLVEGGADFVGELISGAQINQDVYTYGNAHEHELWTEFQSKMTTQDDKDWLYGSLSGKDQRPTDLGYWIGYQITKAYFDKATDKKQAIKDVLTIKDCKDFLVKSGYGDKFK